MCNMHFYIRLQLQLRPNIKNLFTIKHADIVAVYGDEYNKLR